MDYSAVLVKCCASEQLLQSVVEGDRPPQLRRYRLCWTWAKMMAVEYEGEAGFFHSEDSFDSRHVQHHQKDVRFSERPLLDSHSRWRLVTRAPSSPAGNNNMAQREERTYPDDSAWSRVTNSELTGAFLLSPEVIVRAVLGAQETEDTCT